MKIHNLSPQAFHTAMNDSKALVIDVREPQEWQQEHIAGANLIPLAEISHKISNHADKPGPKIYLYCQRGRRSEQAGLMLLSLGYTEIHQLEGGLEQWKSAGFPCQAGQ